MISVEAHLYKFTSLISIEIVGLILENVVTVIKKFFPFRNIISIFVVGWLLQQKHLNSLRNLLVSILMQFDMRPMHNTLQISIF